MAEKGVILSRDTAERFARATKAYEREPVNLVGPRPPVVSNRMPAYALFRVKLVNDGGSNGDNDNAASYTYHAYWPWDASNAHKLNRTSGGAAQGPERARAVGMVMAPATAGYGY